MRRRSKQAKSAQSQAQARTFLRWVNFQLGKNGYDQMQDVVTGMDDGTALIHLVAILFGVPVPKHKKNPKMRFHKLDNLQVAVQMMKKAKLDIPFLKPDQILDHNEMMVLGLIWQFILQSTIKDETLSGSDKAGTGKGKNQKELILKWCQHYTQRAHLDIRNFAKDWSSGEAFIALLNRFKANFMTYSSDVSATETLSQVFYKAHTSFGIPQLLDPADMQDPDERSVFTYITSIYKHFYHDFPLVEGDDVDEAKDEEEDDDEEQLDDPRIDVFTRWINWHITKYGFPPMSTFRKDFSKGATLVRLLNALYVDNCYQDTVKISDSDEENIAEAISLLKSCGVDSDLTAENLKNKDEEKMLDLVWVLVLDRLAGISNCDPDELYERMLLWCSESLRDYPEIDPPGLTNFDLDWETGLPFLGMVHKYQPDVVDYDPDLKPEKACELAFSIAEMVLGVPRLVEYKDLDDINDKCVFVYLSELFINLEKQLGALELPEIGSGERPAEIEDSKQPTMIRLQRHLSSEPPAASEDEQRHRAFRLWINFYLAKEGYSPIDDLLPAFQDGTVLCQLLHALYGAPPGSLPASLPEAMEQVHSLGLPLEAAGFEATTFADEATIVDLLWIMAADTMECSSSKGAGSEAEGLLRWAQAYCKGYTGVDPGPENFGTDWASGLPFLAILNSFNPNWVKYDATVVFREGLELVFGIIEEKLGIPQLLDVNNMKGFDERSVFLYVSEINRQLSWYGGEETVFDESSIKPYVREAKPEPEHSHRQSAIHLHTVHASSDDETLPISEIEVVGIAGTPLKACPIRTVVEASLEGAIQVGAKASFIDLASLDLPYFSGDLDEEEAAAHLGVQELRRRIERAHCIVIGTPAFHGSMSGIIKNALEFIGPEHTAGKMVTLISIAYDDSPNVSTIELKNMCRVFKAWVVGEMGIEEPEENFSEDGTTIADMELAINIAHLGISLATFGTLKKSADSSPLVQTYLAD